MLTINLFNGLVYGALLIVMSSGLALIYGLRRVVNFAHGALYMLGALVTWMGLNYFGINYWTSLLVAPFVVGVLGMLCERTMIRHLRKLDPIYGLLLTFGLAQVVQSLASNSYGVTGLSYRPPELLLGATDLGFMRLPNYRAWVVVASMFVCMSTWYVVERTRMGAYLRAGTENPAMVQPRH